MYFIQMMLRNTLKASRKHFHQCVGGAISIVSQDLVPSGQNRLMTLFIIQYPSITQSRIVYKSFQTSSFRNDRMKRTCWKCGEDTNPDRDLFFCECGVVQRPAYDATFYELLQLEQSFDIDVSILSKQFKDTQKQLHPDKYSIKSKEEQHFAEEQSSLLNKSYDTLLKPLSRAIYLLELEDITISENDSISDPEFLMNMMDDFEKISEASHPEDVASLEKNNDKRIDECIADLSKAFIQKNLSKAKTLTMQLRYFTTVQEKIKELKLKSFGQ